MKRRNSDDERKNEETRISILLGVIVGSILFLSMIFSFLLSNV